jgi:hypothetical protein
MAAWLLSLLMISAPPAVAARALPPVDECTTDASFVAFREELRQAVAQRDRDRLLALVADDIQISFGDSGGRADFIRMWALDQPATSTLWHELEEVLRLGCGSGGDGTYWAPSLGSQLPDEMDPFETVVAVRPGAVLRASPDPASVVVAPLQWDVLTTRSEEAPDDWIAVTMRDGRRGFVQRSDVRSPIDFRAGFQRRGGSWRMITFVAGD